MTTEIDDKPIERLQKLLILAERGGTEAEADSAMCKVQELLTKYNLSMGDIKNNEESSAFEQQNIVVEDQNATI